MPTTSGPRLRKSNAARCKKAQQNAELPRAEAGRREKCRNCSGMRGCTSRCNKKGSPGRTRTYDPAVNRRGVYTNIAKPITHDFSGNKHDSSVARTLCNISQPVARNAGISRYLRATSHARPVRYRIAQQNAVRDRFEQHRAFRLKRGVPLDSAPADASSFARLVAGLAGVFKVRTFVLTLSSAPAASASSSPTTARRKIRGKLPRCCPKTYGPCLVPVPPRKSPTLAEST